MASSKAVTRMGMCGFNRAPAFLLIFKIVDKLKLFDKMSLHAINSTEIVLKLLFGVYCQFQHFFSHISMVIYTIHCSWAGLVLYFYFLLSVTDNFPT